MSITISCLSTGGTNYTLSATVTPPGPGTWFWTAAGSGIILSGGTSPTADVDGDDTYTVFYTDGGTIDKDITTPCVVVGRNNSQTEQIIQDQVTLNTTQTGLNKDQIVLNVTDIGTNTTNIGTNTTNIGTNTTNIGTNTTDIGNLQTALTNLTLGDNTDVVLTAPVDDEILTYESPNWVNKAPPAQIIPQYYQYNFSDNLVPFVFGPATGTYLQMPTPTNPGAITTNGADWTATESPTVSFAYTGVNKTYDITVTFDISNVDTGKADLRFQAFANGVSVGATRRQTTQFNDYHNLTFTLFFPAVNGVTYDFRVANFQNEDDAIIHNFTFKTIELL